MAAEPQLAPGPEMEQPPTPAPAPERQGPASLNEVLTGVPTPEAPREPESLREKEDRMAREGMAKLNEMGKAMNAQAESGTQEFEEKTKSWWDRAKGMFKKETSPAAVKGEAEVLKEIEKADAVYAEFKKKYDAVMASGDEAGLRGMEASLSQAYDQLAQKASAEGAAESKQWKKALKTGEEPQMTETGAKLNDVTRRLQEVRGRLNGNAPKPEAAAPVAAPKPEPAPAPAEAPAAAAPEATSPDREALMKASEGKPGAKMVDEYLALRDRKSDEYGTVVATSFDPVKGEIRVKYEDGSQFRKYSTGMMLRVHVGGKVEEIRPTKTAETVVEPEPAAAPEEGSDENPIELTENMKKPQGVVSGEVEIRPEPEAKPDEPSVVVSPEATAMEMKTSEQAQTASGEITNETKLVTEKNSSESPTASGEIGGGETAEAPQEDAAEATAGPESISVEPGDDLEVMPAPEAAPEPEKKESGFDKLETGMDAAAEALLKMPEASESPKTFPTKVAKLPADKFLEAFTSTGALDGEEAKHLAEQFKLEAEEFNELRKKLSAAVRKKMKG